MQTVRHVAGAAWRAGEVALRERQEPLVQASDKGEKVGVSGEAVTPA